MKKILIIIILATGMMACQNFDKDFPDYLYTSGYFPYQYPVRTIVLGKDIYPNEDDNAHKFLISVAIGGIYENKKDRVFNIELVPNLCNKVLFTSTNDTIKLMPASYYTLTTPDKIIVPKGKVNGGVEVQLTDAFFNDIKSVKATYVIPLRIVSSADVDTILRGRSAKANPDPRISAAGEWNIVPKDYTMYAVNFINQYHGTYLHRGANRVDSLGVNVETKVYRTPYIESNELWKLGTTALNKVTVTGNSNCKRLPSQLKMDLTFGSTGDFTIAQATGSAYTITGTGTFKSDADSWGNKPRDAIYMSYQITSGIYSFSAKDTLVIRDRGVIMQLFTPKVY